MKKIIVSVLVCVVLMLITTLSFAVTGKINTDNVRLRNGASSDATVKDMLSINDKVEIIDESGDWYQIKVGNQTGYVSKSLVDAEGNVTATETNTTSEETNTATNNASTEEQAKTQETTTSTQTEEIKLTESFVGTLNAEVTIKILPSINSTNIEKIEKGTQITIVEIINDWCHIETSQISGWARLDITKAAVSSSATSEQTEEQTEEVAEETTQSKVGYVNTETVNLRQEANTSSEKIDSLTKNTEVTIIGEEGDWYRVQVNGKTGYISKQYLSDNKVEEVTSRAADTARQISDAKGTNTEQVSNATGISTGSRGSDIVEYAMQFKGYNYVSGGSSPSTGFDCSGFTSYVYKSAGVNLSRSSSGQRSDGVEVSKSDLQPGDIVCFSGHVGIYIGNNQFIHAANAKKGVIITSLSDSYYVSNYITARRVL